MAKTSRVTLDRQESINDRLRNTATQAGVPEERVEVANEDEKPTLDEIAEEAYAIYLSNGSQHGFDIDHWLEAERRIASRKVARRRRPDVAADKPADRG